MELMTGNNNGIMILVILAAIFWIVPIIMLIIGLIRLKSSPKSAKTLLIISGIWLTIGLGFCGSLMTL